MPRKLLKTLLEVEVAHFKVRKMKPNSRQTIGLFEIGPLFNKRHHKKERLELVLQIIKKARNRRKSR